MLALDAQRAFSQYYMGTAFFKFLVHDSLLIIFDCSIQFMDKATLGNSAILGIL
jgi:hypothetical protein